MGESKKPVGPARELPNPRRPLAVPRRRDRDACQCDLVSTISQRPLTPEDVRQVTGGLFTGGFAPARATGGFWRLR